MVIAVGGGGEVSLFFRLYTPHTPRNKFNLPPRDKYSINIFNLTKSSSRSPTCFQRREAKNCNSFIDFCNLLAKYPLRPVELNSGLVWSSGTLLLAILYKLVFLNKPVDLVY